jgi:hypothetical protein
MITLLMVALTAGMPPQSGARNAVVDIRQLTVPPVQLPAGCTLAPAPSERLDEGRVRIGLWAGFPANPWSGSDRRVIASMRQAVTGGSLPGEPDGPPMNDAERARYANRAADGVDEGYGAVYQQQDGALIVVRALRYEPASVPIVETPAGPGQRRVVIGAVLAVASGPSGPCFDAVQQHLGALSKEANRGAASIRD